MFIDWIGLNNLPQIDSLIDIGLGSEGTPKMYYRFNAQNNFILTMILTAKLFIINICFQPIEILDK